MFWLDLSKKIESVLRSQASVREICSLMDDALIGYIRTVSPGRRVHHLGVERGIFVEYVDTSSGDDNDKSKIDVKHRENDVSTKIIDSDTIKGEMKSQTEKRVEALKNRTNSKLDALTRAAGSASNNFERAKVALEDIESYPFEIKYFDEPDQGIEFLQPIRLSKAKNQTFWRKRAANETEINNFTAFPQTLAAVVGALGSKAQDNIPLRMLKHYLETEGYSQFVEVTKVGVSILGDDLMVATRCLTLLNLALQFAFFSDHLGKEVYIEIAKYLFTDPHTNTNKLKSMIAQHKRAVFCKTTKGLYPRWDAFSFSPNDSLLDYTDSNVPPTLNDLVFFAYINDTLKDEADKMREAGLNQLASSYKSLFDAEISGYNLRKVVGLNALIASTGYTRSFIPTSAPKQVDSGVEAPKEPGFKDTLYQSWYRLVCWACDEVKTGVIDYNEFVRLIPNYLTSRSAGGEKITLVYYIDERRIVQRGTSKTELFMHDAVKPLLRESVENAYSIDLPGQVGVRFVVAGKPARMIIMRKLSSYLHEIPYLRMVNDYQMYGPHAHEYTVGKETGNIFQDHAPSFAASSNPDVLSLADDFGTFDVTQKEANVRRWARKAIIDGLNSRGKNEQFGPWKNLAELLNVIWGKGSTYDAYFEVKFGADKEFTQTLILDMLMSGELLTLMFNNETNRANSLYTEEKLKEEGLDKNFKVLSNAYQGDDAIKYIQIVDHKEYNLETHKHYIETKVKAAESNGLIMSAQKSSWMNTGAEYLKKEARFGYMLPLLHMQPISAERQPAVMYPTDLFISIGSLYAAYVARGGCHDIMFRLLLYICNFRRGVKMTRSFNISGHGYFYLPYVSIFTPIELGGGGQLPYTMMGANKDALIAYHAINDPDYMDLINTFVAINDYKKSDTRKKMVRAIFKGDVYHIVKDSKDKNKEEKWVPDGLRALRENMLPDRLQSAKKALSRLTRLGAPPLNNLYYGAMPEATIENMVYNSPNVQYIEKLEQTQSGGILYKRAISLKDIPNVIFAKFNYLRFIKIKEGSVLNNWHNHTISPLGALDPELMSMILAYGVGSFKSVYDINPNTLLSALQRDKYFRRDLRPEQIFAYLCHPNVIRSTERITQALLAMGAEAAIAASIAAQFDSATRAFTFRQNALSFSLYDQLIPLFSLDYENHLRVVKVQDRIDSHYTNVLLEIGFLYSVTRAFQTKVARSIEIQCDPDLNAMMEKQFFGRYSMHQFMLLHPLFPKLSADNQ